MEKLICPKCGNELKLDKKTGIAECESCGLSVKVADKIIKKTTEIIRNEHIVDEARIKEAEVSLKALELEDKRLSNKNKEENKNKIIKIIIGSLLIVIGTALTIFGLIEFGKRVGEEMPPLGYLALPGIAAIIVGIILLHSTRKKGKEKK